jgi:tetratricopeptide (TPR) repeat protein
MAARMTDARAGAFDAQEFPVFERASELLSQGNLGEAGDLLHSAAAEAVAMDDAPAAIRLLQLSAATARSAGAPEEGRARAEYAISLAAGLAEPDPALSVLALAEAAECALALQDTREAAREFGEAAAVDGLPDAIRGALLRRQAAALGAEGLHQQAREALEAVLATETATGPEAARVRLDIAGVAQQGGLPDRHELVAIARRAVAEFPDADMHADIALLEASVAAERGDFATALQHTERARDRALAADAPVAYLAASLSEAQFLESLGGDHDHVYTVLARGWEVLEQLAGPDIARAAFSAAVDLRRGTWGDEEFFAVRARYDATHARP